MATTSTRQLQDSGHATAQMGMALLLLVALLAMLVGGWSEYRSISSATSERAAAAADKLQSLYLRSTTPASDELLKKQIRDYHARVRSKGNIVHFNLRDSAGDSLLDLPRASPYLGVSPQSHTQPLLRNTGVSAGSISVSISADVALRSLAIRIVLGLILSLGLYVWLSRRLRQHRRAVEHGTRDMLEAIERFEHEDFTDHHISRGPLELLALQSAISHLGRTLTDSRKTLNEQVDHAAQEVAQTLEEMEIKNVELDLARRRAVDDNLAKSSFLANISHEIRTPMNGIIGHLQLLQNLITDEQQSSYLARTLQASNGLLDIIDDTLNLSRIEADKLDLQTLPFNLVEEVSRCIVMQAPGAVAKKLNLHLFCDPAFPKVLMGDSLRVRQVITNLVSNAIKYTESGSIRVNLGCTSQLGNKRNIILTVTDTGLGMDSAQIDSLFEAFSQAGRSPESGTGLGLLITRSLTEAMGGTLDLVSSIGEGSSFTITLPMQQQGTETITSPDVLTGLAYVDVEDSEARSYYRELLAASGMTVADHVSDSTQVELLMIDHHQLEELNRQELDLVELCARRPLPHVVLISTDNIGLLNRLNANHSCLALPLHSSPTDIIEALQRMIDQRDQPQDTAGPTVDFAHNAPKLSGVQVLLADDDNFGRAYMRDLLVTHGATVDSCVNGAEAAERAQENLYDLILLDIRMPVCDGIEATRRIRAVDRNAHIPIIGMTASVVPEQHMQCMQAGMTDYWMKPLKMSQLLGGLEHWLVRKAEPTDPRVDVPAELNAANNPSATIDQALAELDDEMRQLLVTEISVYSARLKDMYAASTDPIYRQDFAHKLSGTATICKLAELSKAAQQLETTTLNRDEVYLPIALDEVSEALAAVKDRLNALHS